MSIDGTPGGGVMPVEKIRFLTKKGEGNPAVFNYDPATRRRNGLKANKRRTLEQLYEEAKSLGVHGRSDMNKQELAREVDRKKRQ